MTSHDNVTDSKYHSGAIEVGQIYFDHHSDTNGTFECGKRIVQAADKAIRQAMEAQQSDLATLRKQLAIAREALRPFALAAQKGSNVYAGVQMAMKDRPDLFSYSTAYIDAGRSTAHSHLSWSDYVEAREAYEALKGQPC